MVGCVREAKAQGEACEAQKGGEEGQSGSRAEAHGMAGGQNSRSGEGSMEGSGWWWGQKDGHLWFGVQTMRSERQE